MRSTADLIAELDEETKKHYMSWIAVGFPESSVFIQSGNEDRLQLLCEAVENGGIPVGLYCRGPCGRTLNDESTHLS